MGNPGCTDEQLREAVEAYHQHGKIKEYAAASLKLASSTFRNRLARAAERGMLGTDPVMPGFRISKVSTTQDADGITLRTHVQQKPEAGGAFNIPEGHKVKGVSALLDADGNVSAQWVKTREGDYDPIWVAERVGEVLSDYRGLSISLPSPEVDPDTLTVIPLPDWHVGLLAWSRETGEDYDLKIARDVILESMARVIAMTPPSDTAVVLGLGDLLHFDGYEPVTSRSRNFLDADGRYPKVLKTAVEMVIATIDMALQRHGNVIVRILAGNHDDQSAVAVSLALSLFYENNPRVAVDDSPSRFWWLRFGSVFLGATHGDKAKMKDLPLVMAHDRPHDWAASTYRRIYTGHIHHERALEEGGVVVTSLRSPVAKDAYHSFEKYRAGRSVYADTYARSGKKVSSVTVNI